MMRKIIRYSWVVALILAFISLLLLMTTPIYFYEEASIANISGPGISIYEVNLSVPGIVGIFGGTVKNAYASIKIAMSGWGFLAWTLTLLSIIAYDSLIIMEIGKMDTQRKYTKFINLGAVACLFLAGVFTFFNTIHFGSTSVEIKSIYESFYGYTCSGWIIASLLLLFAGVIGAISAAEPFIKTTTKRYVSTTRTVKVNRYAAALLAFFLGAFGIHKLYCNKTLSGILYLIFCWTGIPYAIALVEFFLYLFSSNKDFQEYVEGSQRINRIDAALLAFFLGDFGIHKFYCGQTLAGVLYFIFFWTGIPYAISLIEFFLYLFSSNKNFIDNIE